MASSVSRAFRGELWLIDLGEPIGHEQGWRRPALVVSSDEWNRHASTLIVLPVTRTKHELPTRIELEPTAATGLRETSYARTEDVRAISEARLVQRLGTVDSLVMSTVARTLRLMLEL